MPTYRKRVETTALKCKKGLSVLEAMSAKGFEQRYLLLLYRNVVLSITDYGLGLTTMAQTNLLNLDRVQNEAMRVTLGTTKDTPTTTMRFMLDISPMQTRQKVEQVKAYFSAVENPHNLLHEAEKDTKGCRLGRGKSWMGQAEDSILQVCQLTELKQTKEWERYPKPISASLRDTSARKLGKALSRMASRLNRLRDQASHSRKQQTVRPHSVH